ncbi:MULTISPECIES: hypothetical protein [Streptomyces]|uniref:hypothetical protein n=1 Tax=Streptomyces TaxID=1883 RepID=UPI000A3C7A9E|nr:hypothetical protein [Streptomyces glaucescens]
MFTPTLPRLGPPGPFPRAPLAHPLDRKWLHYAFLSRCGRQALIANLSVLGSSTGAVLADPGAPATGRRSGTGTAAEGQHMAILLAYEEGHGWSATQFNAEQPDLPWSAFRLPHPHGEPGTFRVAARSAAPAADVLLTRTSRPCTSQCAPFGEDEHLRWQSEPGVLGTGTLRHGDGTATETDLLGYHERVRGRWSWTTLGGWVFGFVNDPSGPADAAPPSAVVFTLIQPVYPADAANGSVMLWRDGRMIRHFPRRNLRVAVSGSLDRDRVAMVPPLADMLGTPPMAAVPGRLLITARLGDDRLVLDFRSRTAGRIANPSETSLHPFSVHETLGPCTVEGRIGGRRIGFRTEGIVEFAGGAHD